MTLGAPLELVQNLLKVVQVVPFDPSSVPGFPYAEYNVNKRIYQTLWNWYSGNALEITQDQAGKKVDRYPVKINPFKNIVSKHVSALFGEFRDDDRPLVVPRISPKDNKNKVHKERARELEKLLSNWWIENNGRSLMLDNGLLSQIFGGCIFKLTYSPWETDYREYPIRIERILPEYFFAYPDMSDNWRLAQAWIVSEINNAVAEDYGIKLPPDAKAIMIEYWSKTEHKISINGQIAQKYVNGYPHVFDEKNPYGFVPIVYIPHIRTAKFWGESIITSIIGLAEEYNLRFADYGDAISDDSHRFVAARNINGTPNIIKLSNGLPVINLGSSQAQLTGQPGDPDLFEVQKGSASAPMREMLEAIFGQLRRDAFLPPIADGEDEGSQRSSLTLSMRMWPLTSHAEMERVNWTTGLNLLHQLALQMMVINGIADVTEDDIKNFRFRCLWNPMLPKDRDSLVMEVNTRAAQNLGSPQHLLEMLGDVDDIDEEMKLILEWLKEKAKIQAEAMPQKPGFGGAGGAPQPQKSPSPSSGSKGE